MTVGIRPESVVLQATGGVPARVIFAEPLGSHVLVHVEIPEEPTADGSTPPESPPVIVQAPPHIRPAPDDAVTLQFDPARTYLFDGASGAALHPDRQPSAGALRP